ncbi:S24 family peptidase [Lachnospiraceae bacterium C1.1]|nr:S24 family peptidase [Lachnospiraceae bacterium C1.1]
MIAARISPGDLVLVRKQSEAMDDDIVVALVGNENTLKRYFVDKENQKIRLHPEGKSAILNYENNSRGVSAEMLTQLSRLFHVSADYILNGDTPDNLDPVVNEAIEILNNLKTDKAKQSALAMLRQIQILEG